MSDSPIFDDMASRWGYSRMVATEREKRVNLGFFAKRGQSVINRDGLEPDPYLDGPYRAEEPEVVAQPFVPVAGVPRGTVVPINPALFMPGIGSMTEEEINTPFDKIERYEPALSPEMQAAIDAERYEKVELRKPFDPLELEEVGILFYDFVKQTVDQFRADHPTVDDVRIFVDHSKRFDATETFVITGRVPKKLIQNPDEVMVRPLPGVDLDEPLSFGTQLIGAQGVPEDILAVYREAAARAFPGCIPMVITTPEADGSTTISLEAYAEEFEGGNPKLFSEKNTAQTTE